MIRQHRLEALRSLLEPGLSTYLLIDPLLGEPVPVAAASDNSERSEKWQRTVVPIVLPPTLELSAHRHPYLVCLHGTDDTWIDDTLETALREASATRRDGLLGTGRGALRIAGWLQAAAEPEALAQALATRMRLRAPATAGATYLRLADRRTLDWLQVIIGERRLASASSFARRWIWLDARTTLSELLPTETGDADDLRLSAAEWATFSLAPLVHPCLARCSGRDPNSNTLGTTATDALARVRDAVQRALREQSKRPALLTRDDDVIAWAAMSLLHPGFERRADFAHALASPPSDDAQGFHALCLALCDNLPATTTSP